MNSLRGHVLVASNDLLDPNFHRSVVLVVEHSEEGSMGVVVNRPTTTPLAEAWQEICDSPCAHEGLLHLGGPCEGPILALHEVDYLTQGEIAEGVHLTTRDVSLEELVQMPGAVLKIFIGYSGWGAGQLENELSEGSWRVLPATPELVFNTDDDLWQQVTRQAANSELIDTLGIRHVPDDPSLN